MTDHQEIWEQYFEEIADEWKRLLGLGHWQIEYDLTNHVIKGDPDILGYCTIHDEFGHCATIDFVDRLAELSREKREWYIVHELMHIVTYEHVDFAYAYLPEHYKEWFRHLMEHDNSMLTTLVIELRDRGFSEPQKV